MADWIVTHAGNIASAAALAVFGYFSPIINVLGVMVGTILFDQIAGILAARKRGEGIRSDKLWSTAQKLFYSIAIVAMLYAMDIELGMVEMHKLVAWIICGWEVWSVLEKAAYLTNHDAFKLVQKYLEGRAEAVTGVKFHEDETET